MQSPPASADANKVSKTSPALAQLGQQIEIQSRQIKPVPDVEVNHVALPKKNRYRRRQHPNP